MKIVSLLFESTSSTPTAVRVWAWVHLRASSKYEGFCKSKYIYSLVLQSVLISELPCHNVRLSSLSWKIWGIWHGSSPAHTSETVACKSAADYSLAQSGKYRWWWLTYGQSSTNNAYVKDRLRKYEILSKRSRLTRWKVCLEPFDSSEFLFVPLLPSSQMAVDFL